MPTTYEIAQMARRFMDEPDESYLTSDMLAEFLKTSYDRFRSRVNAIDPWFYSNTVDYEVTADTTLGWTELDLSQSGALVAAQPSIAGPNPNFSGFPIPRMLRVLSVQTIDGDGGRVMTELKPANGPASMRANCCSYTLRGNTLRLNFLHNGHIRVQYSQGQNVGLGAGPPAVYNPTWANGAMTEAGAFYLDDMNEWHDIVALYAYQEYSIMDGEENKAVLRRLVDREKGLNEYVTRRLYEGQHYVQNVEQAGYGDDGWGF